MRIVTLPVFSESSSKIWRIPLLSLIGWLWPFYFALTFTIGRNPDYTQLVIWGGVIIPLLMTVVLFLRRNPPVPTEAYLIAGVLLWSLPWAFFIESSTFWSYARSLAQYTVLVFFVANVIRYTGRFELFFWAMLAVGVFNALNVQYATAGVVTDLLSQRRAIGIGEMSPNQLAGLTQLGAFGALGLLGAPRIKGRIQYSFKVALIIIGFLLCVYGLVAAGGRGSIIAVLLYLLLWLTMCLRERIHNWLGLLAILFVIIAGIAFILIPWLLDNTFLGQRLTSARYAEDGSTQFRLELILLGLKIGIENPLFGVGLGQFGSASGTGYYSHNEFIELFATTGFMGLILYMLVYYVCWQRLTLLLKQIQDYSARYWINVSRVGLLVMFITGITTRPNFLAEDSMFMMSLFIGIGLYFSNQMVRSAS